LNALVRWIVCAVGFREAVDPACVFLAAALLPFVVLREPAGVALLEPAVFALLDPAAFVPLPSVFPAEAVLPLLVGFVVCSVADVELCVRPATPPWAHGTIIPIREAAATAPRSLPQMLVTVSSLFEPTSSTLIAFQKTNSTNPPRTTADTFKFAVNGASCHLILESFSQSRSPPARSTKSFLLTTSPPFFAL
jgi:hypothetical protein